MTQTATEPQGIVRVRVTGRVQGVFFRAWTAETARALSLSGWVRNCRDGSVEALFAGERGAVETMLERCREGPPAARVEAVEILANEGEAPHSFAIRATD